MIVQPCQVCSTCTPCSYKLGAILRKLRKFPGADFFSHIVLHYFDLKESVIQCSEMAKEDVGSCVTEEVESISTFFLS